MKAIILASVGAILSTLVISAPAEASSCSWNYNGRIASGFCNGESISLSRNGRLLTGVIGMEGVSLTRNGPLWSGFYGLDSMSLTKVGKNTYSGFVGMRSVLCSGPLPVGCLP